MPATTTTLITGARILSMDPGVGDLETGEILIEDDAIAQIAERVEHPESADRIEAGGCIVIPGFIDTHRHMWEGILRGLAPAHTLGDYFAHILGRLGPELSPDELYLGNRLSAEAALTAGVTTVQDISNVSETPDDVDALIDGLRDAGGRVVFAYGKSFPLAGREGAQLGPDARRVRTEVLSDDAARVTFSLLTESGDDDAELANARLAGELGVRSARHVMAGIPISRLRRLGALRPGTTFIHGNGLDSEELQIIADSGSNLSVAPAIEMMMGHGYPLLSDVPADVELSLSADVEVTVPADMFTEMRIAYAADRSRHFRHPELDTSARTVRQLLELATVGGARALGLGLEGRIGSLAPGKQADLVILRADRADVAPVYDPYSTVVLQMDRSHIDTVLVAGQTVRRAGRPLADHSALLARGREAAERLIAGGHHRLDADG